MKKPIFTWDLENGEALCIIKDKENVYYGIAKCHPEDMDMKSERTGCFIAEERAKIMMLSHKRDELKIELKALKKYYASMNKSKYFDKTSYPIRRLLDHISKIEADITDVKELLQYEKNFLNTYINEKEKLYQRIRHNK